ncbi:hypothetical protein [Polaromonas vacuolata]|uniref:hypothetical protein n=1 Tax=Polaromonas vacuolata TaxID=37448 RepID=UPI0014567B7C|nr:hypothetical protein [Polaromonas vacuolata]
MAVLYGGGVYACRHCRKLAYNTRREQSHDRADRQSGGLYPQALGILNGNGGKPKGMNRATFASPRAKHDAQVSHSLAGMTSKFSKALK